MSEHNLRTVSEGACDAWDTAPESHKPILRDCSDALLAAADEIERLRAIIDGDARRKHGASGMCCALREQEKSRADRLQAIVDRLPKTADGVPIVPGMKVWFQRSRNHGWEVTAELVGGYYQSNGDWSCIDFDGDGARDYSTREAAEAAKPGGAK